MLEYMASDEFNPMVELSAEKLKNLMGNDNEVDFSTDECFDAGGYAENN